MTTQTDTWRLGLAGLVLVLCGACATRAAVAGPVLEHLDPQGLHRNPAFSQAIAVSGPHRTLYIGGQNAVDASGNIVGSGDIAAQAAQVGRNFRMLLEAAGAGPDSVVKWGVHVVAGEALGPAMRAFQAEFGRQTRPGTVTVLFVPALAHPDFLIEVDAIAVVSEPR